MPPPMNTPKATPSTTNVGASAIVRNTQDSGAPTSRPAAPDRPQQIHSSSAVRPRTTTGWRLSRCGRNVTVPSARTCCCSDRSEEHTSELQSLMRISYAVFCLKKKKKQTIELYNNNKRHNQSHR